MIDIMVTAILGRHTLMAEGVTDEGVQFIDAYLGPLVTVVDAGRLIIPAEAEPDLVMAARDVGLQVETQTT